MKNKIALITGASAGFGEAMAHRFAEGGYDLILTGRREERIELLTLTLRAKHGVKVLPLVFDVRSQSAVTTALQSIKLEWREVDVLINNAGLAVGRDAIQEGDTEDWERMIDTNIKGLLYVSRIVLPWMTARGKGLVINLGSIAGKEVYPGGGVYCATKHAVDALSKAMRIDLLPTGVKVTQISPGAAETEFSLVRFKGDEEKAGSVYHGFDPLTATDIADIAWFAATRPPHVCLNDIVVTPSAQANSTQLLRKP